MSGKGKGKKEVFDVPPSSDEESSEGEDLITTSRVPVTKQPVNKTVFFLLRELIRAGVTVQGEVSRDGMIRYAFRTPKREPGAKSVSYADPLEIVGVPPGPPPVYEQHSSRPKHSSGHKKRRHHGLFSRAF